MGGLRGTVMPSWWFGQDLSFFYLIECYLINLISYGRQFAIVLFKVTCNSGVLFCDLRTETYSDIVF